MSYFLNTGCFVSEEFKNQKNFSYFLNEEFIFSGNRKNLSLPPVKRPPPGFNKIISPFDIDELFGVKRVLKRDRPPNIITDLNTNASPFSPINGSPNEDSFFDFNEMTESLLGINEPKEIEIVKLAKNLLKPPRNSARSPRRWSPRSPNTSPKGSPRGFPNYRIIYRKKKE